MDDKQRKAMFAKSSISESEIKKYARKPMKEITTEIWESKTADNMYGKKIMMFIDRKTGNEEMWVRERKEIDKAWVIDDKGESERDPSESYGGNGFRRANWKERKLASQSNEDLD